MANTRKGTCILYEEKVSGVIVNNSSNISKMNYHLSPQTYRFKSSDIYCKVNKDKKSLLLNICVIIITDYRLFVSIKRTGAYNAPPFLPQKSGENSSSYL